MAIKSVVVFLFVFFSTLISQVVNAEPDWYSVTIDNDLFVGSDSGYTNGLFYSWFDLSKGKVVEPGFLARSMLWSLSDDDALLEFTAKTVGQIIVTPDDITLKDPQQPPDEIAYAGLLFYGDNYVKLYQNYAEKVSVRIGIIGKYSFAEESQSFIHSITGSDEPRGWDTQLDDEIVFQFMRESAWKSWTSDSGNADILLGASMELGTISSSLNTGFMFRYGRQLNQTFASALLVSSKVSNPVVVNTGWYLFAGAKAGYVANQIFLDGNTFDNDKSMHYNKGHLGVTLGLAYAWKDLSLTFAIYDLDINDSNNYSEYGTLTLAWRNI